MKNLLVVITGPTAVGKTKLSIEVAQHFQTSIISADSRQFYKGMDIGTAKPTPTELAQVKHHFIDCKTVDDYYSAGDFERDAIKLLDALFLDRRIVIATGGSGLYLKALIEGLDEMPAADLKLRNQLIDELNEFGLEQLQLRLKTLNPKRYADIDTQNPQRVMRAMEMTIQGTQLDTTRKKARGFDVLPICLNLDRSILYNSINQRVDEMMASGLLEEATRFYEMREMNALQTVGYTELFEYFDRKYSLETAIDKIKQHTRNYAKRQLTWFKKQAEMHWFRPDQKVEIIQLIEQYKNVG